MPCLPSSSFAPYVPDGLKAWTPDQCANSAFVAIRPTADMQKRQSDDGPRRPGRLFTIASAHGTRAGFGDGRATTETELCRRHLGRIAFVRGRARPVICVRPSGEDDKRLVSFGRVMANRQLDIIPGGHVFALVAHDAPRLSELYMTNQIGICGVPA